MVIPPDCRSGFRAFDSRTLRHFIKGEYMSLNLLDRVVKVKIPTQRAQRGDPYETAEAMMTIREAIKAGYLQDAAVALQIFEQVAAQ